MVWRNQRFHSSAQRKVMMSVTGFFAKSPPTPGGLNSRFPSNTHGLRSFPECSGH